jgi:hypothetical protein
MWVFSRMLAAGLAFAACTVVATAGHAQAGAPFTLVWAAPESCPQQAEFRGQIERFLQQSLCERREQGKGRCSRRGRGERLDAVTRCRKLARMDGVCDGGTMSNAAAAREAPRL